MTNPMLAELDAVVRLMEKATPGPWVANDGELATDLYLAGGGMVADALAEFADGLSDPPNAQFVAAAVNFLRTHHATLADMAKRLEAAERDAARYRWLRDKAHEEHRITTIGIYIKWGASYELGSIGGADADDEIDDAMAVDATQEGAG